MNKLFIGFFLLATSAAGCRSGPEFHTARKLPPAVEADRNVRRSNLQRQLADAIKAGDAERVSHLWNSPSAILLTYDMDVHLALGRFFLSKNRLHEAKMHLDPLVSPPPNVGGTFETSGEAMRLWLKASVDLPQESKKKVVAAWVERVRRRNGELDSDVPEAQIAINSGVELEARERFAEALEQFRAAAHLDPGCSYAWYRLGTALELSGAKQSARDAFATAYKTAKPAELTVYKRVMPDADPTIRRDTR